MAINFDNISSEDLDRVNDKRNPSAVDAGDLDGISGDAGFDDLFGDDDFGDINDIFGDSSGDGFGNQQNGMVQSNGMQNGNMQMQNGFYGVQPGNAQVVPKKDAWDIAMEKSAEGIGNSIKIMTSLIKSLKNRTADDTGYFGSNMIKTGGIGLIVAVVLMLVGKLTGAGFLDINHIGGTFIKAFALTASTGMVTMGISAMAIAGTDKNSIPDIASIPNVGDTFNNDATDDYEEELGDIMEELFGSDDDNIIDIGEINTGVEPPREEPKTPKFNRTVTSINYKEVMKNIGENRILNRKLLFETFEKFLPTNNPDFADKKSLDQDDQTFKKLETICLRAMANVLKCEISEVNSLANSIIETFFSYEIKMKRVRGLTKTAELAAEIAIYLKERPGDDDVSVSVDILGDYYFIVISKGLTPIITFADMFNQGYVRDFFLDEGNKLPMITGVTELGEVVLDDAKLFDTMLIAGKPRSGKSWYVLSILVSLMFFNSPEDVQFIIIDPKESNLFKTLSLMPHVAGLHNDDNVLNVMDDVIINEASRRKKLLADNRCDDIWALRKKGVKLPVLYFVIDEYITVKSNLGDQDKDLDAKLQVMISQLPSQGIRLIFVPHRATGVVNKTNRTMLQYTAAVRSDNADVIDTLGIKSWTHPLTKQGDVALKSATHPDAIFVRGAALTTSDEDNTELIENVAKAFYKMGVDLPDMSVMTIAANRDEAYIRDRLVDKNRVQYNADTIFTDI